tara:strand:+ start:1321 stop:1725 length:405 start_codon:yes stop_codon:yes gene_type:complete
MKNDNTASTSYAIYNPDEMGYFSGWKEWSDPVFKDLDSAKLYKTRLGVLKTLSDIAVSCPNAGVVTVKVSREVEIEQEDIKGAMEHALRVRFEILDRQATENVDSMTEAAYKEWKKLRHHLKSKTMPRHLTHAK